MEKTNRGIFHYTNGKALMNIIEQGEFWVSHGYFLNDYGELTYMEEVLAEACIRLLGENSESRTLYNFLRREIHEEVEVQFEPFILSFSLNPDSVTLWSEYSDFYGYNLEIDIVKLRERIYIKEGGAYVLEGKVIYDRKEQVRQIINILVKKNRLPYLRKFTNTLLGVSKKEKLFRQLDQDLAPELYAYAPFFKKACFKQEEEYRFIFLKNKRIPDCHPMYENNEVYFKQKEGSIVPYIKVNFDYNKQKLPIRSIRVGAKNNNELAGKGTLYYLKSYGYEEVPVLYSQITLRR